MNKIRKVWSRRRRSRSGPGYVEIIWSICNVRSVDVDSDGSIAMASVVTHNVINILL